MKCDEDAGTESCQPMALERIRYFTGRHMTARDFKDGDAYYRSFRHLHNRVLHGWGIACGLDVEPHPNPECGHDRVVIKCGLALDCCGREVVLPRDVASPAIDWDVRPTADGKPAKDYVLLLALTYVEKQVEQVPVLYSPDACSAPAMACGRIREGYAIAWYWVSREHLGRWGWVTSENCDPAHGDPEKHPHPADCRCGCRDEPAPCCLQPDCPEKHVVPLAVFEAIDRATFDAAASIDRRGRRLVAQPREQLTHICGINWVHGGLMKVSDIHELRVRFDRPLMLPEHPRRPGPRGINERTFVVQYGEQLPDRQMEDLDFVEYRRRPHLSPDRRTAIYQIRKPGTYRSHIIHVTLRCDFILDCWRRPVDGDHLGGELPTGNGIPGGTFESWFHVVEDDDYDSLMKELAGEGEQAKEQES
jgi:hypothetical protein